MENPFESATTIVAATAQGLQKLFNWAMVLLFIGGSCWVALQLYEELARYRQGEIATAEAAEHRRIMDSVLFERRWRCRSLWGELYRGRGLLQTLEGVFYSPSTDTCLVIYSWDFSATGGGEVVEVQDALGASLIEERTFPNAGRPQIQPYIQDVVSRLSK